MLRSMLLTAARSTTARRLVEGTPLSRSGVDRFIPGTDLDAAFRAIRTLVADRLVTVDHLGEDTTDRAQADRTVAAYIALLQRIGAEGLADRVEVSIKLSALGQRPAADAAQVTLDAARRVCAEAGVVGTTVTVDMEAHTTPTPPWAPCATCGPTSPGSGPWSSRSCAAPRVTAATSQAPAP